MKRLIVGDPHVKPDDLEDCERLLSYIKSIVTKDTSIQDIDFLGDMFHTMGVIHSEVLAFWTKWLYELSDICTVNVIVGNHDQTPGKTAHSLLPFKNTDPNNLKIYDKPATEGAISFLPYIHDNEEFVKAANEAKGQVLYCHATFDGSQFETGYYAKGGIDPDLVKQKLIISGHLHTSQNLDNGRILYPGSPRWLTASDANVDKHIWIVNEDWSFEKIPTDTVCSRIVKLEERPGSTIDFFEPQANWRYLVDVHGPKAFVNERKEFWADKSVKLRVFIEREKTISVKESKGIISEFGKFVETFKSPNGTPSEVLKKMVSDRLAL